MIISVTLNAAIDRTVAVPNLRLGHRHRSVETRTVPGGKGINVARALGLLGRPVIATGLVGGGNGDRVLKQLGETFGVPVIRERIFGEDYAKTLATWRNNFREAWPNLMPLGFDDRFRRLWEYYLSYCEAGFLSGNIDVRQVVFAKSG